MLKKILHFDINGTITNIDSTENANMKELININMSKNLYGKINNDNWQINMDPFNHIDSISYYNFLKKNKLIDLAKICTDDDQPCHQYNDILNRMLSNGDILFQSFKNILLKVKDCQIVFRTFGHDADIILNELESFCDKKNFIKGEILGSHNGYSVKLETGENFENYDKFMEYLGNSDKNFCLKDDYHHWNNNNKNSSYGKPIYGNKNCVQIFWDDNDCIAKLNEENVYHFKVNTIEAFLNNQYFLEHYFKVMNLYN